MDSVFCRTTSISASSTSESSESKRFINSEEITIEDFTKKILMIEKFQKFQKHKFIKIPNLIFSKLISQSKLKKEIFSLQYHLKPSNSFLKNPYKNIKIATTNIFILP
jgi:hypothetical protein